MPLLDEFVIVPGHLHALDQLPKEEVLTDLWDADDPVDRSGPVISFGAICHRSNIAHMFWDAGVQMGSDLTDRATLEPAILPEFRCPAITHGHHSLGEEKIPLLNRELKVEATPSSCDVRAAQPLPSQSQH
jgi:hypothetical protein